MKALLRSHGHRRSQSATLSEPYCDEDFTAPAFLKKLKSPLSFLKRRSVSEEKSSTQRPRFSVEEYRDAGVIYGTRMHDWTRNRRASYAFEGGSRGLELFASEKNSIRDDLIKEEEEGEEEPLPRRRIVERNDRSDKIGGHEHRFSLDLDQYRRAGSFNSRLSLVMLENGGELEGDEQDKAASQSMPELSQLTGDQDQSTAMTYYSIQVSTTGLTSATDLPSIAMDLQTESAVNPLYIPTESSPTDQSSIFSFQEDERIGRNLSRKYYKEESPRPVIEDVYEDELDEDLNYDDDEFDDTSHLFEEPEFDTFMLRPLSSGLSRIAPLEFNDNAVTQQLAVSSAGLRVDTALHGIRTQPLQVYPGEQSYDSGFELEKAAPLDCPVGSRLADSVLSLDGSEYNNLDSKDKWNGPLQIYPGDDMVSNEEVVESYAQDYGQEDRSPRSVYSGAREYVCDEDEDDDSLIDEANMIPEYYNDEANFWLANSGDTSRTPSSLSLSRRLSSIIRLTDSTITLFARNEPEEEDELHFGSIGSMNSGLLGPSRVLEGKSLTPISERSFDSEVSVR